MPKKKKKTVRDAPFFIRKRYTSPEVKAIAERLSFFNICEKICKYTAPPLTVINLLLFLLSVNSILNSAWFAFPKSLFINIIFPMGIMNIFTGLLLLAKD